jgi:pyrroloquinoline quinone biosynthesis protein E
VKRYPWSIVGKVCTAIVGVDRGVGLSACLGFPLAPPISVGINITKRCNSKCLYCLCWQIKDAPEPTLDEMRGVIDSLARLRVHRVAFSGGEPLLREDLEDLVAYAHYNGLFTNVLTNGLLATTKRVERLIEAGLDYLTLSMDSADPRVYTFLRGVPFEAFERRLEECIQVCSHTSRFMLSVHSVICRANLESIPDLVKYLDEREVFTSFQIIHPVFNAGGKQIECGLQFQKEDELVLKSLIEELIKMKTQGYRISASTYYLAHVPAYAIDNQLPPSFHCRAGYSSIAIDHHLNAYSCWPLKPVGNLHDCKLEDLWFSSDYQRIREQMWRTECPRCWLSCHAELGPDARKQEIRSFMRQRDEAFQNERE